jgi:hypothetical protein
MGAYVPEPGEKPKLTTSGWQYREELCHHSP